MPQYRKCIVLTCENRNSTRHRFPNPKKYLATYRQWINLINNPSLFTKDPAYVYDNYRICETHFGFQDLSTNNRLRKIAIPSMLLPTIMDTDMPQTSAGAGVLNSEPTSENMKHRDQSKQILQKKCKGLSPKLLCTINASRSSQLSPKAKILYKTATKLQRSVNLLKIRRKLFKSRSSLSKDEILSDLMKDMTPTGAVFIRSQINLNTINPKGRRYTINDKILGLILQRQCGRGYNSLVKMFSLPSRKTISRLLQRIPVRPGINNVIFQNLATAVSNLAERDRYCVLMFDEMSIQPHLRFNPVTKEFDGFITKSRGENEPLIADHALVFLVKGITKAWKQPLVYTFSKGCTKTTELAYLIELIIKKCQEAGLGVLCTVCDQGSTNTAAVNFLIKQSLDNNVEVFDSLPYLKSFVVNGARVFHLYDPPHLIKGIRNNLLKRNLVWDMESSTCIARWSDIRTAYAIDNVAGTLRAMPKLTEAHVNPSKIKKMKVSYATQIFSHSVSSVMALMIRSGSFGAQGEKLTPDAFGTVEVLRFFDSLMDSVNGQSLYPRHGKMLRCAVTGESDHLQFWEEARNIINHMYFQAEGSMERLKPPSLLNWLVTLDGLKAVYDELVTHDINFLKPRALNQDSVENLFGQMRQQGVSNNNPTCTQFMAQFKTLLINNFLNRHSISANCEDEKSKNFIGSVHAFIFQQAELFPKSVDIIEVREPALELKYIHKVCLGYVAGFITKYAKKLVSSCSTCKDNVFCNNETVDIWHDLVKQKEFLKPASRKLKYCTPHVIITFCKIYNLVQSTLPTVCYKHQCIRLLLDAVDNKIKFNFSCKLHSSEIDKIFKEKFVFLLCHNWASGINRVLRGLDLRPISNDFILREARSYYEKHKYKNRIA